VARFRDRTPQFLRGVGWGRVGYRQEPIHVFNDEYTALQLTQPFSVAFQGTQKHQEERDMDTEWNRWGFRDSFLTAQMQTGRYQQDGSFLQLRGAYGPIPATAIMNAPTPAPQSEGLLADFVRAVKRAWKGTNG
jgi:hypothetical protein